MAICYCTISPLSLSEQRLKGNPNYSISLQTTLQEVKCDIEWQIKHNWPCCGELLSFLFPSYVNMLHRSVYGTFQDLKLARRSRNNLLRAGTLLAVLSSQIKWNTLYNTERKCFYSVTVTYYSVCQPEGTLVHKEHTEGLRVQRTWLHQGTEKATKDQVLFSQTVHLTAAL